MSDSLERSSLMLLTTPALMHARHHCGVIMAQAFPSLASFVYGTYSLCEEWWLGLRTHTKVSEGCSLLCIKATIDLEAHLHSWEITRLN